MKCSNHDKREELGLKNAFEVYYGRKTNELLNNWKSDDDDLQKQDFENQQNFGRQWRKVAMKAGMIN